MKTYFSLFAAALALSASLQAETPAERLAALGITLQAPPAAIANYVPAVRAGNLVFLAGQIAKGADGKFIVGKVGDTMTEAEAIGVARQCGIQLLSALQAEIGDLAKVKRVVRVAGYVNATADFTRQSIVINGCSDLLVEVFGEAGRHARAAVGVASLPAGAPVEVEMIIEIAD
ncbi:MAG: RidA family protein [Opitutaceae bacterium]|nr:RidA family protein [Opitutaceae bacterium]